MRFSTLLVIMALLASTVGVVLSAQTSTSITTVQPPTFGPITFNVNLWYTTPLSTYGQAVGEVNVVGIVQLHNNSAFVNFTSAGYLATPSGTKSVPVPDFVLAVFPTGSGVYVLTFNTSSITANVTNVSGSPYRSIPSLSEVLWYYNGSSPVALVKGNITSVLPTANGIYVVEATNGKVNLLQFQGRSLASSRGLPEPLYLLYEGSGYLLVSTSAFSISPQLITELSQTSSSYKVNYTKVEFYKLFPNGSLVSVKPNVNVTNATVLALPGEVYGANLYVVYNNGTYALYLYNGSSTMEITSGINRVNSTTPELTLPFVLAGNGLMAYSTTTLNMYSLMGSGGSNLLTSDLQVLLPVNGSWTHYGSFAIRGVPLAMTRNGSIVTVYYLSLTPTFSFSTSGTSVSIIGTLMSTNIYVGGPVAFNYSVYTQIMQGKKYLVITWAKPTVQIQENVSVYLSINGGPFKLYETVPVSSGVVYFQVPSNATTISVYLVVSNPLGSLQLSTQTVSLTFTTSSTSTTLTTPTQTTTSATTTQSTATLTISTPAITPTPTSPQQSISSLEIAFIAVVAIVIIIAVALHLRR